MVSGLWDGWREMLGTLCVSAEPVQRQAKNVRRHSQRREFWQAHAAVAMHVGAKPASWQGRGRAAAGTV